MGTTPNSSFKNNVYAKIAAAHQEELERIVHQGIAFDHLYTEKVARKKRADFHAGLSKQAVPVLKAILQTLNPDMFGNIRRFKPEAIWDAYWDLRASHIYEKATPVLTFLQMVNSDREFAHMLLT